MTDETHDGPLEEGSPIDDLVVVTTDWSPDHPAVHRESHRADAADGQQRHLAMLRHPTYPFAATLRDAADDLPGRDDVAKLLFDLAGQYLQRIPQLRELGLDKSTTSGSITRFDFGWLPLAWGEPVPEQEVDRADPRLSFWVSRCVDGTSRDRTAVLIAGNRESTDDELPKSAGGEVGLRVVVHVGERGSGGDGRCLARVTGLVTSGLQWAYIDRPEAAGPSDAAAEATPGSAEAGVATSTPGGIGRGFFIDNFRDLRIDALRNAQSALNFDDIALDGFIVESALIAVRSFVFRLSGTGRRGEGEDARFYAWTARVGLPDGLRVGGVHEQLANATPQPLGVLRHDPASCGPAKTIEKRRPSRDEKTLSDFRSDAGYATCGPGELPAPSPSPAPAPAPAPERIALRDARAEVVKSRIGNTAQPPQPVQYDVPNTDRPLRSDDMAAVHAYIRAQELFARFDVYGLRADSYFKSAKLPLRLRPRASFHTASNGEVVNAQVGPDGIGQHRVVTFDGEARPRLNVSFGAATLAHRQVEQNDAERPRPQYLGLAADPRWAWHEFGHVLAFASTGELEFRFAHSAGDALAAIVADPDSKLADSPLRRLTFPWVLSTRSHDRPADRGWCWCGRRNRLRHWPRSDAPPIPGGYFEEQLMSSSLFRLYRCAGGDSADDVERRRGAADYVVYLVMRAIALLGPAALVPARTADAFVSALIDADIGTGDWLVAPSWPDCASRRRVHRVGGALHKVIRWAFERQGLYATDRLDVDVEGPGLAPPVDLFIGGVGARTDGGYEPVALNWDSSGSQPWHASANSIFRNGDDRVAVMVGNRGQETATSVTIVAWISPASAMPLDWRPLTAIDTVAQNVTPGGSRKFCFERIAGDGATPSGPQLVLAASSCRDDRANLDSGAALPCGLPAPPTDTSLLIDLVANDNNLGLRIVDFD